MGCGLWVVRFALSISTFTRPAVHTALRSPVHTSPRPAVRTQVLQSPLAAKGVTFIACRYFCKDISTQVSLCRDRVDTFLRQLHAGLGDGEGAFDLDFVGLRKVANAYGVPLQELLTMLGDHRIRATRHVPDRPGIHGYLFDRITAQKAFDEFLSEHAGGLDKEAAAACLGLRLEELMELRRMGVIASAEYGGAKHPRFTSAEIEGFKQRFVTKRSLGLARGRDAQDLLKPGVSYGDALAFTVGPRAQHVYRVDCLVESALPADKAALAA